MTYDNHTIHGLCKRIYNEQGKRINHPLFNSWRAMTERCNNKNYRQYHDYGGRGITICHDWLTCNNFVKWAFSNGWEKGLCIDRVDNNKGYSPDNCRWVTQAENNCNQRIRKDNKTGYRGISFSKKSNIYVSSIRVNGKTKYLGQSKDNPALLAKLRDKYIIDNNLNRILSFPKDKKP